MIASSEPIASEEPAAFRHLKEPPLPPPVQLPPAVVDSEHKEVVAPSDAAGKLLYRKIGKANSWNAASGPYHLFTTQGSFCVRPEHCQLRCSKPEIQPWQWPEWSQLSKEDSISLLAQIFCLPQGGPRELEAPFIAVSGETVHLQPPPRHPGFQTMPTGIRFFKFSVLRSNAFNAEEVMGS